METRRWLAFANRKRCNHAQALKELGFINWTMNHVNFNIGDIVYLFLSDERCVRFKTIVVDKDCRREDSMYWIEPAPNDSTYKLELVSEYNGSELSENELKKHGFNGGRSIENPMYQNIQLIDYIDNEFLHQKYGYIIEEQCRTPKTIENVKKVIQILIYWAKQGRSKIPYIEIAHELGHRRARQMDNILGCVHDVLSTLSKTTGIRIPTLNALAVNDKTKIPSDGFKYVSPGYEKLKKLEEKLIVVKAYNQEAFDYKEKWDWVLESLELTPFQPNLSSKDCPNLSLKKWGYGGEGKEHKWMKEYICNHPESLNLSNVEGVQEYMLLSADRIDVLFEQTDGSKIAVEVKPSTAPDDDILRGIYQCVKYKALLDAQDKVHGLKNRNQCFLVMGGNLSQYNRRAADSLNIEVIENYYSTVNK